MTMLRTWRIAGLAVCALVTLTAALPAQDGSGGVRGVVRDPRGAVPAATVTVGGTTLTAVTGPDGTFAFDRVEAGDRTLRVDGPGGIATLRVRVRSGRWARADLWLAEDEGTPPPEDSALATRTVLNGTRLRQLPIDDARQALALVPGVVLRGIDRGVDEVPDVTIRGSGADQTTISVDGAPARFELFGAQGLALPTAAIAALSVESGVRPAEVGDAGGAALGYAIRSGGARLEGGFTASGESSLVPGAVGYTFLEAHGGGPVPFARGLTFFLAGSLQGQPSAYRGAGASDVPAYEPSGVDTVIRYASATGDTVSATLPRFVQVGGTCGTTGNANTAVGRDIRANYGYDCQGLRRPLDWGTSRRGVIKLLRAYGDGSHVSVTAAASDLQRRYFPGSNISAPGLYQGERASSRLVVLDWSHHLAAAGERRVSVAGSLSYGVDESLSGPLDPAVSAVTASPAFGIEFRRLGFLGLDLVSFPHLDDLIRRLRLGIAPLAPYDQRTDLSPYQQFLANPYGVGGWPTGGMGGALTLAREQRVAARAGVTWATSRALRLSAGADLSRTSVAYYSSSLLSSFGIDAFLAHPSRTGVFASARLARGDVLAEVGVRADRFDAGADFPVVPGRTYGNPDAAPPVGGDTTYAGFVSRVFTPSRPQTLVSPHARLAFAVGPRTTVRLGYGEEPVRPPLSWLYASVNTDILLGGGDAIGQDVRFAKTGMAELGVHHTLRSGSSVDASVYQKSNPDPYVFLVQAVYDPLNRRVMNVPLLSRWNTRFIGADARFDWRVAAGLSGSLTYSYSSLHIAGSATLIARPDRSTHALAASVALEVPDGWRAGSWLGAVARGVRGDVTARAMSGLPYTANLINSGTGTISPTVGGSYFGTIDGAHLPWNYFADLRLAKAFAAAGARWSVYLEVRNLLNTANLIAVFTETGKDVNALFRDVWESPYVSALGVEPPAAARAGDGTIDLTQPCSAWRNPADCVALQRVENRFGDGDGHYTPTEQRRALDAYYESIYGTWRFHGPARTARLGVEVRF